MAPPRIDLLPRQALVMMLPRTDFTVYGGAAGGAKTWGLAAITTLDCARSIDYSSLLLRKTLQQARKAKSLWPTLQTVAAKAGGTAYHSAPLHMRMPNRGIIEVGHLQRPNSIDDYMSAAYNMVGIDEATQVRCEDVLKLHSRIRDTDAGAPNRMMLCCNPDRHSYLFHWVRPYVDPDHELYPVPMCQPIWMHVKDELTGACEHSLEPVPDWYSLTLIPSRVEHNPYYATGPYKDNLRKLPAHERARFLTGSWLTSVRRGDIFNTRQVRLSRHASPPHMHNRWGAEVRGWDCAASEKQHSNADYCAGGKVLWDGNELCITDMVRERVTPATLKNLIVSTAQQDGPGVRIAIEREPGSQGGAFIHELREALPGYHIEEFSPVKDKIVRSRALSQLVNDGMVIMLDRGFVPVLIAEFDGFGTLDWEKGNVKDDQIDGLNIGLMAARGGDIFMREGGWVQ